MPAARTVVGVFRSERQAENAVRELRSRGFGDNEISVIGPDRRGERGTERDDTRQMRVGDHNVSGGSAWGAGIGGAAGLLAGAGALAIPGLGPLVALGPLAATLTGAATGGLAGGLADYGIPQNEGRDLENRVREGEFLCVVRTEANVDDARRILKDAEAQEVRSR